MVQTFFEANSIVPKSTLSEKKTKKIHLIRSFLLLLFSRSKRAENKMTFRYQWRHVIAGPSQKKANAGTPWVRSTSSIVPILGLEWCNGLRAVEPRPLLMRGSRFKAADIQDILLYAPDKLWLTSGFLFLLSTPRRFSSFFFFFFGGVISDTHSNF